MTDVNFRLNVYGAVPPEQGRNLVPEGRRGTYRRVNPADPAMWIQLGDRSDTADPDADRSVSGSVVGDERQPGDDVAGLVSLIWYDVPAAEADEFESWFAEEHAPILLREPAWLRCRRVRVAEDTAGSDVTHLVVHELADQSALSSPHLDDARATPARADMAARPWFAASVIELFARDDQTGRPA